MWEKMYRVGWLIMFALVGYQIIGDKPIILFCMVVAYFIALYGALNIKD